MNKNEEKWFLRGIAIACANINGEYNQPAICVSGLSGFKKKDFVDADVPDWDMNRLLDVFQEVKEMDD